MATIQKDFLICSSLLLGKGNADNTYLFKYSKYNTKCFQ